MGLLKWLSGKEPTCQCRRHRKYVFDPWVGEIPWRRKWQLTPVFKDAYSMDMNLSKLWERVEDRGAWHATVHAVTKNQTRLSSWTTTNHLIMVMGIPLSTVPAWGSNLSVDKAEGRWSPGLPYTQLRGGGDRSLQVCEEGLRVRDWRHHSRWLLGA